MRILNREEFFEMPENTLYSKYEPCNMQAMEIKGKTIKGFQGEPIDWFMQRIHDSIECDSSEQFSERLFLAQEEGVGIDMDFNIQGRDGCFDEKQLFAVWEKDDVRMLVERLKECL